MAFSAFVFVVAFCAASLIGVALVGEPVVWVFLAALVVAVLAVMSIHIAMQWEKVVVLRLGKFSRTKGPGLSLRSRSSTRLRFPPISASW